MSLPKTLASYESEAKRILSEGRVRDLEFSGGTYQVRVISGGEAWAFFQFDAKGTPQDLFCSCEKGDELQGCVHLAAALLAIYSGHLEPLHMRFAASFWNALFFALAEQLGTDAAQLQKEKDRYEDQETISLRIKKNHSIYCEMIEERRQETETTSIKFSNVSDKDLKLYRQGRPPFSLSYELSFWIDLAKRLFTLQESGESYTVRFVEEGALPARLIASFEEIEVSIRLNPEILLSIIPSLDTIEANLSLVILGRNALKGITFDPNECAMLLEYDKTLYSKPKEGELIGIWTYLKGEGFFGSDEGHLIGKRKLRKEEIAEALDRYRPLFLKYLKDAVIHHDMAVIRFTPSFDESWTLHINAYLRKKGDLDDPQTQLIGNWLYVTGKGFYRIETMPFDKLHISVLPQNVGKFVRRHRLFFNTQQGFHTHLGDVEAQLTYEMDEPGNLHIVRLISFEQDKGKDFGGVYYLPELGFFAKAIIPSGTPVRPQTVVPKGEIPYFIRANEEELKLVQSFFSAESPIQRAYLDVSRINEDSICIRPVFEAQVGYNLEQVEIFGDYSYVKGEGFHPLPAKARLPDAYYQEEVLKGEDAENFFLYGKEHLKSYIGKIDPQLEQREELTLKAEQIKEVRRGRFSLPLFFETELGRVWLADLLRAMKKKKRFFFSEAGLIDLEDERIFNLSLFVQKQGDSNALELDAQEVLRLQAIWPIIASDPKSRKLLDFQSGQLPQLVGFTSRLRPYQELGVQWLYNLYLNRLSGLLCDDMGLGKTHQAMGLIAALLAENKRRICIVCPTSVLYHWQEKLEIFLPKTRVLLFHGTSREMRAEHDILLTSYGIVRREVKQLRENGYDLAIFDEVQIAKNPLSATHKALKELNAKMAIGLTGTPIENHLGELKALFDLVLPGYMPTARLYDKLFIRPIEKEGDREKKRLLKRLIQPFILRRRKEDVLEELPEKIEEVAHCDLGAQQKQLYTDVLMAARPSLLQMLGNEAEPVPYMHIFSLLTKLKQVCDHPAVYYKLPENYRQYDSGKWDLFVEYLQEARQSGQKVVVFSHYLTMLDIFENYLSDEGIGFAAIRGTTVKRGGQIQRFNTDPECEVFVASLQAAGLGIDLTGASVVIHYDRWWNAAREEQATDRVHRIGQTRGVQVFKLVTKDTFEERIDEIISRKGALMEEMVGADDHRLLKLFTRDDLVHLLQSVQ